MILPVYTPALKLACLACQELRRRNGYLYYFMIIDYKTGTASNAKGKENLFYGLKIQLFVYAQTIKVAKNKKIFGAFYLPIKNTFSKDSIFDYSLCGFLQDSFYLASKCDTELGDGAEKSRLLDVSVSKNNKDGEICLKKKNNILTADELDAYCKYSIEVCKEVIKCINGGNFEPIPFAGDCQNCEFNKICKNSYFMQFGREETFEIESKDFLEITNE